MFMYSSEDDSSFRSKTVAVLVPIWMDTNMAPSYEALLKEQYPVTAHAPNLDFWTGCREIKRCEESKRTLKNPFASRLTGFNTTLKLLRITDQ